LLRSTDLWLTGTFLATGESLLHKVISTALFTSNANGKLEQTDGSICFQ